MGRHNCNACPMNSTTTTSGSTVVSDCVCVHGSTGPSGKGCICGADTWKGTIGSMRCTSCPQHSSSFLGSTAVTECTCNAGFTDTVTGCAACPIRMYNPYVGSSGCRECAIGKYSGATGSSSADACLLCTDNSKTRFQQSTAISECLCLVGYNKDAQGTCKTCISGTFKLNLGSEPCIECAAGKYWSEQIACTPCPQHSSSPAASAKILQCSCQPGFTSQGLQCVTCSKGTFKTMRGDQACTKCSAGPGTYGGGQGQISDTCTSCNLTRGLDAHSPEGSTSIQQCKCNAGHSVQSPFVCESCEAGKYKESAGNAECKACPQDSETEDMASTNISHCLCSRAQTSDGNCTQCPSGTYGPSVGSPCQN